MSALITLTTASSVLNLNTATAAQPLDFIAPGTNSPIGTGDNGDQIISVMVTSDNAAEAGVLRFVLWDGNNTTKWVAVKAQLTATAFRSNFAGSAANNFLCDVAFPDLSNKLDLIGLSKSVLAYSTSTNSATVPGGVGGAEGKLPLRWFVVCESITGTQLNILITPQRSI